MRHELARLLPIVRTLLDHNGFTEVDAVADVWLTLLSHDQRNALFLGAVAVVQLAKTGQPHVRVDPTGLGNPP